MHTRLPIFSRHNPKTMSILGLAAFLALFLIAFLKGANAAEKEETQRVLAIGGAVTEIIYALGEEDRLVGRDSTSLFPEQALALPDVGYIRALSPEGVLSVKPDLVLARENNGPKEAVEVLKSSGLEWVDVPDNFTVEGIEENIRIIAEALGVPKKGDALRKKVIGEVQAAEKIAKAVQSKKRIMFVLSMRDDKISVSGKNTAADGIIDLSGGINVIDEFEGYKQVSNEAVINAAPEVILMMKRRSESSDHGSSNDQLNTHPALSTTPAVKNGDIIRMDGLLMLGFGPRTGEAVEALSKELYGDSL